MAAYAYVDLENLDELIKKYGRQRADPQDNSVPVEKTPLPHYEPPISSDIKEIIQKQPTALTLQKNTWLLNSADYNHVKFDPQAPDFNELMPKVVFADKHKKWWFYHEEDFEPFKD